MMGKEKQTTTEILAFGFAQARMTMLCAAPE
jgi:hypothetical protein